MEGMPEDVAPVPFADRGAVLGGASEHIFQIGPCRCKLRQHDAAVPGIVRDQRQHVELGIVSASIVDQFDGGTDTADMRADHVGGARK